MDDEDLVLTSQLDHALEEAVGDRRTRGVVGIVEKDQARSLERIGRDRLEVRGKAVIGEQRQQHRLGAGEGGPAV